MDLAAFAKHLEEKHVSKLTIKNYLADIRKFGRFIEQKNNTVFAFSDFTGDNISAFKTYLQDQKTPLSSQERYLSSLRKYATFLHETKLIPFNPFSFITPTTDTEDVWGISDFKKDLTHSHASQLTTKNYVLDIKQFTTWLDEVYKNNSEDISPRNITTGMVEEYRRRLLEELELSPLSVNRKLSSIRKYISFLATSERITEEPVVLNATINIDQNTSKTIDSIETEVQVRANQDMTTSLSDPFEPNLQTTNTDSTPLPSSIRSTPYSAFAPIRFTHKIKSLTQLILDILLVAPIIAGIEKTHLIFRKFQGKNGLFGEGENINTRLFSGFSRIKQMGENHLNTSPFHDFLTSNPRTAFKGKITNLSKTFYAPLAISTSNLPRHKKIIHHLRYTRPDWYRKYHTYPIAHYFHFAILMIFITVIGASMYSVFFDSGKKTPALAALPTAPPRILSFQGRLTDSSDNPIETYKNVRFAIYSDVTATGSGNLLWQELLGVTPDQDGVFSVLLGNTGTTCADPLTPATAACSIPSTLFSQNATLYLGITIENDTELTPRQQVASVAYAVNSETLQGLPPSTAAGAGQTNVVLALDSSGNLTIGGSATPTFQASGGQFTLSGTVLKLSTTASSNTDIQLAPDGSGKIDLQKAIINSTYNGPLISAAGAVQINDLFAVNATSSGQSAFTLNQDSTGPLISASASGVAKFTVTNSGGGYFASSVGIGSTNPSATLDIVGSLKASGAITFSSFSNNGGVLYTNGSGVVAQTAVGSNGECLQSIGGGTPIWGSCGSGSSNYWQINSGAISPYINSLDLLLGATSTASAKFGFINVATGNPTATISGNLAIAAPTGSGPATTYSVLNGGTLNFQTSVGGDAGLGSRLFISNAGNIGINSTSPTSGFILDAVGRGRFSTGLSVGTTSTSNTVEISGTVNQASGQVTLGGNVDATSGVDVTGSSLTVGGANFSVTTAGALNSASTGNFDGNLQTGGTFEALRNFSVPQRFYVSTANDANVPVLYVDSSGQITLNAQGSNAVRFNYDKGTGGVIFGNGAGGTAASINSSGQITAATNETINGIDINTGAVSDVTTLATTGTVTFANYTTDGGLLYTNGSGVVSQTTTGTSGYILQSNGGGAPTWVDSGSLSSSYWALTSGALYPKNATTDLLIGGSATTSAKFGFINVNSGNPTATISGNFGLVVPTGSGPSVLQNVLNGGTLNFQTSVGGDAGLTSRLYIQNNGNLGVGTTTSASKLDIQSPAVNTDLQRWMAADGSRLGRFTETSGGAGWFEVDNSSGTAQILLRGDGGSSYVLTGNFGIGTSTPGQELDVNGDILVGAGSTIDARTAGTLAIGGTTQTGLTLGRSGAATTINSSTLTLGQFTTNGGLLYTNGSGVVSQTGAGTANQVLHGGTTPSYSAVALTADVTGTLPIANGGTNSTATPTNGGVAYGTGTAYAFTAAGSSGYVLQSNGAAAPTWIDPSALSTSYWNVASGAIYTKNATLDFLLGGSATSSAKFGLININSGNPTATISGNLAIAAPTGSAPATTYSVLNGGTINFRTSVGGDAGATNRLTILNNGNIGIGSSTPTQALDVVGNITANGTTGLTLTGIGSGITFATGTGNHDITASAGTLRLGAATLTGTITGGNQNITGTGNISATSGSNTITGYGTIGTSGTTAFTGSTLALTGAATGATSYNGLVITANTGVITTGTWNGTVIGTAYGGLGASVTAAGAGELLYSTATTTYGHLAAGTSGQVLLSGGAGAPSWSNTNTSAFGLFDLSSGAIYPKNATTDLLIGGNASSSARIAFLNINTGNPTASLSGNLSISSPTGSAPSTNFLVLNGGSINFRTSVGGDAGASTKLSIGNTGILTASAYTANGGLFYANGSGVISQTAVGSNGECLQSIGGGTPTWGSCGGAGYWTVSNGLLYPNNATLDLAIGGSSSSAAKFVFSNVNSGTPTFKAYDSSGSKYVSINHDGTDANITASNGLINIGSGGGTTYFNTDIQNDSTNYSGFVKVSDKLLVQASTEASKNALVIFDNTLPGDIFTASASGTTKFVIDGSGNVGIGTKNPSSAKLEIVSGNILLDNNQSFQTKESGGTVRSILTYNSSNNLALTNANSTGNILFQTGSSSTERMRIDSLGNVGIGTTTIPSFLTVSGATTGNSIVTFNQTTSNADIFTASHSGTTRLRLTSGGSLYVSDLYDQNESTYYLDPANASVSSLFHGDVQTDLDFVSHSKGLISSYGGIGRGENYFRYSEQLNQNASFESDTNPWVKSSTLSVSTNNTTGPDGTSTAEALTGGASTNTIAQTYRGGIGVVASNPWTFSVWIKNSNTTGTVNITIYDGTTTQTTAINMDNAQNTNWRRYSVTLTSANGSATAITGTIDLNGNNTKILYAWGAQLERQTSAGTYIRTSTARQTTTLRGLVAASSGPSVIMSGNDGIATPSASTLLVAGAGGVYGSSTDQNILQIYNNSTGATNNDVSIGFLGNRPGNVGNIPTQLASVSAIMTDATGNAYAGELAFSTAGTAAAPTERLRITSTGNVGIGTTTPTSLLTVAGAGGTTTSSIKNILELRNTDANTTNNQTGIGFFANRPTVSSGNILTPIASISAVMSTNSGSAWVGDLVFSSAASGAVSAEKMRLTGAGNLGIGTTTAGEKLDVNGNILVAGGGTIDVRAAGTLTIGGTTQTGLTLGRTGQSTTIAANTLTLNGVSTVTASSLATFTTAASLAMSSTTSLTLGSNATLYGGSAANSDLTLHGTSDSTRTSSYVIIQPTAGNVGIGTTSPISLVTLGSAPSLTGQGTFVTFGASTGNSAGDNANLGEFESTCGTNTCRLVLNGARRTAGSDSTGAGVLVGYAIDSGSYTYSTIESGIYMGSDASDNGIIVFRGDGGDRGYFDGSGNFVVAAGNFVDSNGFGTGGTSHLCDNGNVIAVCTSDERFKTNISYIQGGFLEKIRELRPVTYDMRSGNPEEKNISGFIAQEVLGIIPGAVYNGNDGYYGFRAETITPWLVGATQEIDSRLSLVESTINLPPTIPEFNLESPDDVIIDHQSGNVYTLKYHTTNTYISRIIGVTSAVIANLKAGAIQAEQITSTIFQATTANIGSLTTESLRIASTNVTIAGQSINDFIDARVNALLDTRISQLTSPLASTSATVTAGKIVIKPEIATTSPVLEVQGNASISGQLSANNISTTDLSATDATISGTLRATTIEADNLTALAAQVATLSATTIVNNYTTTISSGSSQIATPSADFIASLYSSGIQTDFASIASLSAQQAFVPSLSSDFITANQGLIALGPTSLADTSVVGQLSIDGSLFLSENSINVFGTDLQIQPLQQGGIQFEGGKIAFDTDGNIRVDGNATFGKNVYVAGTVSSKYISALPGSDLEIRLPSGNTKLAVKNASGSAVFQIDQVGDVIASGSGQFKELLASGLTIVRGAQADDSLIETTASGSAGTAIIKAHQTERTINTPYVSEKSLIYITATSDTQGVTPYVARQTAEDPEGLLGNGPTAGSFTIQIPTSVSKDIKLNWWIVN